MTRRAVLAVLVALLAASCSSSIENNQVPECSLANGSSVVLLAQAVPTAELVPCIDELQPGWSLGHLETKRGEARFTLDSDAVGDDFIEVDLVASCPAAVEEAMHVVPGGDTRLSRDVRLTGASELSVAVIPVSSRQVVYSNAIVLELAGIAATADVVPVVTPAEVRIAEALAAGRYAVVVDDFSLAEDLVFVHEPSQAQGRPVERDDLADTLADLQPEHGGRAYQGSWQFRFHGGCVTYRFDATGPAVASLDEQVPRALSFVARSTLDRFTRINVGLRLDD